MKVLFITRSIHKMLGAVQTRYGPSPKEHTYLASSVMCPFASVACSLILCSPHHSVLALVEEEKMDLRGPFTLTYDLAPHFSVNALQSIDTGVWNSDLIFFK